MRHFCLIAATLAGFSVSAHAAPAPTCPALPPLSNMRLTFNDEFKGPALDTTKWTAVASGGAKAINNESQAYVPDRVTMLPGGGIRLQANNTPFLTQNYTSGEIITRGHFAQTYGYFEMKAKLPNGKGLWPAFWMLRNDGTWPPEITVLEYIYDPWDAPLATKPSYFARGLTWPLGATAWTPPDGSPHSSNTEVYLTDNYKNKAAYPPVFGDWGNAWHSFGVAWYPGMAAFYVDGKQNSCWVEGPDTKGSVPNQPMYLVANLAIGAKGGWPGTVDDTTQFPANMDIAWIRAYQFANSPAAVPDVVSIMNPAVTPATVSPGEDIVFSLDVVTGEKILAKPASADVVVFNYDATQVVGRFEIPGPTSYGANTTVHLQTRYKMPPGLSPGTYTLYTCITWAGDRSNQQCLGPNLAPPITVVPERK